jgi:hypothetical protein
MPQFTMNMDENLLQAAKLHALQHGTTVSDMIRELLARELSGKKGATSTDDRKLPLYTPHQILTAYSRGRLGVDEAAARLGLQGYRELAIAMADAELPLPGTDRSTIDTQAAGAADVLRLYLKDDSDA